MSVGGGVKGTIKLRLSLEGPPPIRNVYQRRRFVRGGGGKNNLKLLLLSLEVPPPIRLRVSTSSSL